MGEDEQDRAWLREIPLASVAGPQAGGLVVVMPRITAAPAVATSMARMVTTRRHSPVPRCLVSCASGVDFVRRVRRHRHFLLLGVVRVGGLVQRRRGAALPLRQACYATRPGRTGS